MSNHWYHDYAVAYLNGAAGLDLDPADGGLDLTSLARASALKLTRFKRTGVLPRVSRVLGALRGIGPQSLLDIGTGRGAFLWPFLEAFPDTPVTCVERLAHRVAMLSAVARGGIDRLSVIDADGAALPFPDASFDVVTALEVLEHQVDPFAMAREATRVARRFVVASVPSKPDDNPEHVQLFTSASLRALLIEAGAASVSTDHVPGHIVVVATIGRT